MRKYISFLALTILLSCSNGDGITEFEIPVSGKQIGESWEAIIQNAKPCDLEGCGELSYKLFRVNYPNYSILFIGAKEDEFDPSYAYFSIFKEMGGKVLDYNMFIAMYDESTYLNETEFVHSTENAEILPMDNFIKVSDTGFIIPSRQPEIIKTFDYALRELPVLELEKEYKVTDLLDLEYEVSPATEFHFWERNPVGYWSLDDLGLLAYLEVEYEEGNGGSLVFGINEGHEKRDDIVIPTQGYPIGYVISVFPDGTIRVNGREMSLIKR